MSSPDEISDIDGFSHATRDCVYCKLKFQEDFMMSKLCKNCRRLFVLYQLNQLFQKFFLPGLLTSVLFYLILPLRQYALIPAILVLVPPFAMNIFQQQLHFRGVEETNRIIPLLRYSKLLNDNRYYNRAIEIWQLNYNSYSETYRNKILNEFVRSILIRVKPNPMNWLAEISKPTGLTTDQFVSLLFRVTDIRTALEITKGTGTLPDIWPFVDSEELKIEILDIIEANFDSFDEATAPEKKLFMEDLYLIDEDVIALAEKHGKWNRTTEELDKFEPETPPKNMLEEVKMNTQSQTEMQQLINS